MRPSLSGSRLRYWLTRCLPSTRGLQRRIMIYVAMGSVVAFIFFGFVAQRSLQTATGIIHDERLQLTRLLAHDLAREMGSTANARQLSLQAPDRLKERLVFYSMVGIHNQPMFHTSLLDDEGQMLLESHSIPKSSNKEHEVLLQELRDSDRSGVVIHRPPAAPDKAHIVAYAPLPGLQGGVTLEQMNEVALVVPRALRWDMSIIGAIFTATGLALAWLTTRQVVGPLTLLTAVTRKIAAGDLSTPIPQGGRDEVADLAVSFETMRQRLRESRADLNRANRELESRVQERTQELEQRHADLTRATDLLVQREAERTFLLQKTIQAQEDERRRVARDLHDTVAQFLSLVVLRLSMLEVQSQESAPQLTASLGELRTRTSEAVDDVRRLIVDLRPELLDDLGLAAALGSYAEQMLGSHGISVDLDVNVTNGRLTSLVELVVFRVMQEALTNVFKHARAKHVRISLSWEEGRLTGSVIDDGVGFEPIRSRPFGSDHAVGLLGMRERIALLGGTLQIRSSAGEGTRVLFQIAMEGKEERV